MAKMKFPATPATRFLKAMKIEFDSYMYNYEEHGGTAQTAKELGIDEHAVIKTLVFRAEKGNPYIVLMHGDKEVSAKELARQAGSKKAEPCDAKTAMNFTGYQFGGTSPFGTRKEMKIYAEESIFELNQIYINGGKQGYIIVISPRQLDECLKIIKINVAI